MSSKRGVRRRACEGKVRHSTVDAAWFAARRIGAGVRPYRCAFGNHWHIGHQSSTHKAAMRAHRESQ